MELVNLPQRLFTSFTTLSPSPSPSPSSSLSLSTSSNRSFQPLSSSSTSLRRLRCRAASPNPPPPPPENESTELQGVAASLSKFQDRVQIFFAVLFWMTLFFWASAWDGRNRPNKGSKFRK